MRLTPMRYKDYIWPSNPGSYRISFRRVVAEHKLPFGRSVTQDLGQACRVLEGEGEFAGEGAYEEFKRLATVFYGGGAGVLVHPVWMTTRAYFTELEVVQEPLPDYVRYRFAFCEAGSEGAALKEVSTSAAGGSAAMRAGTSRIRSCWWTLRWVMATLWTVSQPARSAAARRRASRCDVFMACGVFGRRVRDGRGGEG